MINARILVISTVLTLTAGCAATPPSTTPDYAAAPPAIASGFHVAHTEVVEINVPREQFLAWKKQTNLSAILTPTEGMPAVANTVMLEGEEWGETGDKRRVELSDGHYAVERLIESTDERLSYQVWGFTSAAGRFADYATGEFLYEDQGETTLVTWNYQFRPSSFASRLPLTLFVRNTFQGFMANGLANMKAGAETSQPSPESALEAVPASVGDEASAHETTTKISNLAD